MKRYAIAVTLFLLACGSPSDGDDTSSSSAEGGNSANTGSGAAGASDGGGDMGTGGGGGGVGGGGVPGDGWPLGIPVPSFGIDEVAGAYTHYVDNTSPSCSDSSDGTADAPRCTLPKTLTAGAVVEIHGGPYEVLTNDENYDFAGTETEPIFFSGIDMPVMDGQGDNRVMKFSGSYFIVEGLRYANGASARLTNGDHQVFRHSEIDEAHRTCLILGGDHGVAYGNELHHCHDGGKDRHGVQVGQGTTHNWVIGNHIHHNSSNGIQYTHGAQAAPPDYVFVGANVFHDNREVGVASKWALRTVVSSNHVYNVTRSQVGVEFCMPDGSFCMVPESATNGPGIHVGADGFPEDKWVIHNVVHDAVHCIRVEDGIRVRIIGNLCHDIEMSGVNLEKSGEDLVIAHNTFSNVAWGGTAAIHQYWRDEFAVEIRDNLFITTGVAVLWFESSTVASTVVFDNNLVWNGGSPFTVRWLNQTSDVTTASELESLLASSAAEVQGNTVVDPLVTIDSSQTLPVQVRQASSPTVAAADDALTELDAELKATFGDDVTLIPDAWQGGADIGAP